MQLPLSPCKSGQEMCASCWKGLTRKRERVWDGEEMCFEEMCLKRLLRLTLKERVDCLVWLVD